MGGGGSRPRPTPYPTRPPIEPIGGAPSFYWSYAGPQSGRTCVQWLEPSDPHTWNDNYLCSDTDWGLRWSYAGPISGMRCTQIIEPSDPHTWTDNYFCAPSTSPLTFYWSYAGPTCGSNWVQIVEPSDPHTWGDNYLCWTFVTPAPTPAPTRPDAPDIPGVGYIYVDSPRLPFGEAQAYCLDQYGANLATIYNDDLQDTEDIIFYDGVETWIGLYDGSGSGHDGLWSWRNGDVCEYPSPAACVNYWGPGNYQNGINTPLCVKDGSGYPCGYILDGQAYNNLDCNEERPFICHLATTSETVGDCPCDFEITDTCDTDGYVTFSCVNTPSVYFNEATPEGIRSCIYIEDDIIPDGITVEDVIMSTQFTHTWVGDLYGWLLKDTKYVTLFDGACDHDDADITLSDTGPLPAYDGSVCDNSVGGFGLGGNRFAIGSMSIFDGDAANGQWSFAMVDTLGADSGVFGQWQLKLKLSSCPDIPDIYLAKSVNYNTDSNDFKSNPLKYLFNGNTKHSLIHIVGLNGIIAIVSVISILLFSIIYCICRRKRRNINQSTKAYDKIGGVKDISDDEEDETVENDEIAIKENM